MNKILEMTKNIPILNIFVAGIDMATNKEYAVKDTELTGELGASSKALDAMYYKRYKIRTGKTGGNKLGIKVETKINNTITKTGKETQQNENGKEIGE